VEERVVAPRMPPLNPLRVFEVAARLGAFNKAALELGVTQSAVSRQIATLEHFLKTPLFRRLRQGACLTPEGEAYLRRIAPAFAAIAAATEEALEKSDTKPLRVRAYTSFIAKWLIRRLPQFKAANRGCDVRLINAVAPVDFAREDVDFSIQLGLGGWRGTRSRRLFADVIQPVCSPRLREELKTPDDLRRVPLLHAHYRHSDWPDWLAAIGRPELATLPGTVFPSSVLTYEAAVQGHGVAIGQVRLLEPDFAAGTLVPLFDRPVERALAYHLVWPEDRELGRKARLFADWLCKAADEPAPAAAKAS
jgi:LysR family glycine cleavage system transcriptional activator